MQVVQRFKHKSYSDFIILFYRIGCVIDLENVDVPQCGYVQ